MDWEKAPTYTEPPEINFAEDFFTIMGLAGPGFQQQTLANKWFKMARLYHPDKNMPMADKYNDIMKKLNFVHEVLTDKAKLKRYVANQNAAEFRIPGEPEPAAGASTGAPAGASAGAKTGPNLGQQKLFLFFKSDDYCRPARASLRIV